MSCILTIGGPNFNVDAFIAQTKLRPYRKRYKGQPKFKTKSDGTKLSQSSMSIEVSKADFASLSKQIADTIRFLKRNRHKFAHISTTKGIDYAILDFGINLRIDKRKVLTQSDKFPSEVLKLAGELGLDIELSIYPVKLQTILERQYSKKKKSA